MDTGIKKQTRDIVMLTLTITSTVIALIAIFVIYCPYLKEKGTLNNRIRMEREKNVMYAKIGALNRYVESYKKRLADKEGINSVLETISEMASKEQVVISSIRPEKVTAEDLYNKYTVILDTVSTYSQLGRFICQIESAERFLKIDEINISRLDTDGKMDGSMVGFSPFDVKAHIVVNGFVLK